MVQYTSLTPHTGCFLEVRLQLQYFAALYASR
jgi:hypothetical protein